MSVLSCIPLSPCASPHRVRRLSDGRVLDTKVFHNDFINLSHNSGAFLLDDMLAVLSIRFQRIHVLQVWEAAGKLVECSTVGPYGREDDALLLRGHLLVGHASAPSPSLYLPLPVLRLLLPGPLTCQLLVSLVSGADA